MKNLSFLLALLLMCSSLATAQSSFKKHSLGINVSNDISSQFIKDDGWQNTAKPGYGLAFGAMYQYRPVKLFSIETGLEYNRTSINMKDSYPYGAQSINFLDAVFQWDFRRTMSRVAIPLNFRIHWPIKDKWSVYGLAGAVFAFNHKVSFNWNDSRDIESYNLMKEYTAKENFNFGLTAGVGTAYNISSNLQLCIEPRFRVYDVAKIRQQWDSYDYNYWTVGLNLCIYYGFGN